MTDQEAADKIRANFKECELLMAQLECNGWRVILDTSLGLHTEVFIKRTNIETL